MGRMSGCTVSILVCIGRVWGVALCRRGLEGAVVLLQWLSTCWHVVSVGAF